MPRYAALSSLTVAALAVGLFASSPAMASDVQNFCPFQGVQLGSDGSQEFGVEANGAGCVVADAVDGRMSLAEVIVAPGWTDQVKRSNDGRVEVRFSETSTNDRVEVRIEPGKTEVK